MLYFFGRLVLARVLRFPWGMRRSRSAFEIEALATNPGRSSTAAESRGPDFTRATHSPPSPRPAYRSHAMWSTRFGAPSVYVTVQLRSGAIAQGARLHTRRVDIMMT